jgi:hypothetical protein
VFNDEELFYMNRVAFRGFKRFGINFVFTQFIKDLEMLQTGPYRERLNLWLTLVQESEELIKSPTVIDDTENINLNGRIVSKQKFTNVIRASFPQDAGPARKSFEDIADEIYGRGDEAYMQHEDLLKSCISNPDLAALMKAVL